jgi:uncharacterized OsmC-like protein
MQVEVTRTGEHEFVANNDRGASVRLGRKGQQGSFSPVELLLAAAAGCAAVTAETLITRRVEGPLVARASDVRPEGAHELDAVPVSLDFDASGVDEERLAVIRRAVEQLCTVTRTLKKGADAPLQLPTPFQTASDPE